MGRICVNSPFKTGDSQAKNRKWPKRVLGIVVGAIIFSLGVQYGQGNIGGGLSINPANKQLGSLDYQSVNEVYSQLKKDYDGKLEKDKLLDGLKAGLTQAAGDPYTEYLNADAAKEFDSDLNGSFTGVGAELSKDASTKSIIIVAPLSGFPAEKAGLRPKDVIAEIDGKSATDLSISEAVKRIRGPKGTKVKLKIVRDDAQAFDVEIERAEITIPSVESKIDGNIGYIKVSRFAEDTVQLSKDAAQKFKNANVKGVVLDVRGDPGGLLDAAVGVSSLWLKDKTVLTERRDGQVIRTYRSEGTATLAGIPTIVLIDEGSASASEITAGALRDNEAAKLYGQKSFGKGSVQQLQRLAAGGILKVTVARWFTPNGKNIDKAGLEPDTKVERTAEDFKNNRDPQLDKAKQALLGQ